MDPSLMRQREAFKARALKMPTVEYKRKIPEDVEHKSSKKMRPSRPKPATTPSPFDYKLQSNRGSSQYKFSILSKIVRYMRDRHQKGDTHPLNIDEVLDETNQLDVGPRLRHWLATEALNNNPKIQVIEGDLFKFKPKYNIRDRKGLLRLLEKHDQQGLGGILMDDVEESLPRFQKVLKILGDQVIQILRPIDKKMVLFYNNKNFHYEVDEDIQKLWRAVAVEGIDEGKIEDYLNKQGISSMQDLQRLAPIPKRKKVGKKKVKPFKTHNEHMGDLLQDYSAGKQ